MAVMKVFAGPPGTGKTWSAAREAVRILRPGIAPKDVQSVHEELVKEGRIIWVTFHPSYSYEDFVEGFRPEETPAGNVAYSIVPGPFLRACQAASAAVSANRFHVGQELGRYRVTHVEAGGLVLATIANNRRDAIESEEPAQGYVDFWTLARLADMKVPVKDLRIPGKENDRKKEVAAAVGLPSTFWTNAGRHAAVYEALQQEGAAVEAAEVVLVIDEINRADLSRVFGELITLLEFDKRQGATEARQVSLTYSGKPLSVPAQLSIIGTMNTADKSLSAVDLALRRRFEFEMVPPDPSLTPTAYGGVNVRALFTGLNRHLAALNGSENLIGHADYMESKLEDLREREGYTADEDGRLKALAHTLRKKAVPFLVDLFRSDWTQVEFVVGEGFFEVDDLGDLGAKLQDLGHHEAAALVEPAGWWNPAGGDWSADKLRAALPAAVATV
ncbi:McrB family protein [Caulobacter endophyticus]|uniref:ATPase dynein-related AAA domain-containing protein n=1 Tax=Caulobacter endophyticus TaxID=2172652 RepID=A0A2T9KCE6_9CAUL|nr:AAA family ATPase [Caulobacter endophyticus]PVM93637.1 hypothetical protein DDF67_02825 [Caulobacter endophyticus]